MGPKKGKKKNSANDDEQTSLVQISFSILDQEQETLKKGIVLLRYATELLGPKNRSHINQNNIYEQYKLWLEIYVAVLDQMRLHYYGQAHRENFILQHQNELVHDVEHHNMSEYELSNKERSKTFWIYSIEYVENM